MSTIHCHVDYASTIWLYSFTQSVRDKLQTTQNKTIRFVLNLDPRSRIENGHFSKPRWLSFCKRVDFTTLCHVFNTHVNTAPSYMHENFTPINEIHHYGTRFRVTSDFTRPESNLSLKESSRFTIHGVKGFGLFLIEIFHSGKTRLKVHMM